MYIDYVAEGMMEEVREKYGLCVASSVKALTDEKRNYASRVMRENAL